MTGKTGIIIAVLGAVLMLSALLLSVYNSLEDKEAGKAAESHLEEIQQAIIENEDTSSETQHSDEPDPNMPEAVIDGYSYIGYLSIPALEVNLPVMSEWDYDRLKIAPCRHFGSSRTDNLVIAAHNYKNHFGRFSELEIGNTVRFTDMDGIENNYVIEKIEKLKPTQVDEVQNSGYDLVMYTCTYDNSLRITVFCSRTEE